MKNFTLITALTLCSFSWISVSGYDFQAVEVLLGQTATLTCSNVSSYESMTWWSRLVTRNEASCIAVMYKTEGEVEFCNGIDKWKFEMTPSINNNNITVFLNIHDVTVSDSGLYFCGFSSKDRLTFRFIHLDVKEEEDDFIDETYDDVDSEHEMGECDETAKLTTMILGGLTVFLVMVIIVLVVKNRKLSQTATAVEEQNPEQRENVNADDLMNYAAVTFQPKERRRRELEPNVIYSTTR